MQILGNGKMEQNQHLLIQESGPFMESFEVLRSGWAVTTLLS